MKIKEGFVLREVAGQTVVIATGEASKNFHGMVKMNATAADIWKGIEAGLSKEQIAEKLAGDYEVDYEKAVLDTEKIIDKIKEAGFLDI